MIRIGVLTSIGISLKVVANDIVYSAKYHKNDATVLIGMDRFSKIIRLFDRIIIFIPFDPHYVISWVSLYDSIKKTGKDVFFYTTIEGIPDMYKSKEWVPEVVEVIANSNFTAQCLNEIGVNVSKIIPHGINLEQFNYYRATKKRVNKKYVVFGTIGFSHFRKGFDKLEEVVKIAHSSLPNAKFYILSDDNSYDRFKDYPNVIYDNRFSQLSRDELIKTMTKFDFYLCTSKAEGFGLPILEAQALGIPCIHPDYNPLNEISHPDNFRVKVTNILDVRRDEAIIYKIHEYSSDDMFNKIVKAYKLFTSARAKYNELSKKLVEHASKYDARYTYSPLVT